jgi:hypothetical protein
MYELLIAIITAATSLVTAISTAITAHIQKRSWRRQRVIEVLNELVIPLINMVIVIKYKSRCQYSEGVNAISTTTIDIKLYAKSGVLYRRFIELLEKYCGYDEFQREINEFNKTQQALEEKVNMLRFALVKILREDKCIKALWESRVKKTYPDWDYMKAQSVIIQEFISSWCSNKAEGVWHLLGEDLWGEIVSKFRDVFNEIDTLIERRRQIAQKLEEMLKKVLDKTIEDYNILYSELKEGFIIR